MSHDEHGSVDGDEREHGPEWWAMGREFCTCGHHYDEHGEKRCNGDEDCLCTGFVAQSTLDTPRADV